MPCLLAMKMGKKKKKKKKKKNSVNALTKPISGAF
jgi:hypothetical protein